MEIEELNRRRNQQEQAAAKQVIIHMCTDFMMRLDKTSIDNAMNILCACAASTIRNRLHNTQYMEAVSQFAGQVHQMLFSQIEVNKEQQEIKEAVLADLAEVEQWASRGKFIVQNTDVIEIHAAKKTAITNLWRFFPANPHKNSVDFIKWLDEQLAIQARQGIKKENQTPKPVITVAESEDGETKLI